MERERPLFLTQKITVYEFRSKKPGQCRKMVNGVMCGAEFKGPPNRKFCNKHSEGIRNTGTDR